MIPGLVATLGLVASVLGATVVPASASSNRTPNTSPGRVTFGIEPASATGADGRPNLSFGVTAGATLDDHVAVLNYSSIPLSLQVYATDAVETSTGGFGLLAPGAKPSGVGSWITLPPSDATVRVPAKTTAGPGQVVIPVAVRVPDNATPGDHAGGIVASLRTIGTNASGQNVVLVQRIGTRVLIRVAGALLPKLSVSDLHASYNGTTDPVGTGTARVSYLVSNSGNVDLSLGQSVAVSGWIGGTERASLGHIALLLPGASLRESVVVPEVWPGIRLQASVSARPTTIGGSGSPSLGPVSAATSLWAIPWALIALVLLVIACVVAAFRIRRGLAARRLDRAGLAVNP